MKMTGKSIFILFFVFCYNDIGAEIPSEENKPQEAHLKADESRHFDFYSSNIDLHRPPVHSFYGQRLKSNNFDYDRLFQGRDFIRDFDGFADPHSINYIDRSPYFGEIPHGRIMMAYRTYRQEHGLPLLILGSIRKGFPFFRDDTISDVFGYY